MRLSLPIGALLSGVPGTARNIAGVYLGDILSKGVAAATTVIIIRTLSKEDYGLYTNFLAIMNFLALTIGTGMNCSTTRYASECMSINGGIPSNVFASSLGMQLALYLPVGMLLVCYPSRISNAVFGTELYSRAVSLGGLASLGLILIQIVATIYQSSERFKRYVTLLNGRQAVLLAGILLLWALNCVRFEAVAHMTVFVQLLFGTVLMVLMRRWFAVEGLDLSFLRESFNSGGKLMLFHLFLSLFSQLGVFMIARYNGAEDLAVYGVAFRYYGLALMLLSSIHAVLLPKFSRVENNVWEAEREFVMKWLRVSSLSVIPVALAAYFAGPLLLLLNGQQYQESTGVFRVFCLGIVISLMFSPLVNILIGRRKCTYLTMISFAALLINLAGNFLVIGPYGVLGIAAVNVLTHAFVNTSIFIGVMMRA